MAVIREEARHLIDPKVLAAIMAAVTAALAAEPPSGETFTVRNIAQEGQSVWRWTGRRESMRGGWPW